MPYKVHDWVIHPAHGAGQITNIESIVVAGEKLETYVILYPNLKHMTLRVPTQSNLLRKPVSQRDVPKLIKVLRQPKRKGRRMWSQRKRDLEAKMSTGNAYDIAAVARDTYRADSTESSYSESEIQRKVVDMLAREIAASKGEEFDQALRLVLDTLAKAHS